MDGMDLITAAAAITPFLKLGVDVLRGLFPRLRVNAGATQATAIIVGMALAVLWRIANRDPLGAAELAQSFFVGALATGGAVAITEVQKSTNPAEPPASLTIINNAGDAHGADI